MGSCGIYAIIFQEARQNEVAKKVENALEVAGLSSRDVTPFLKVRVTSLVHKISATKTINKEGLITIWNPTEKQVCYNFYSALKIEERLFGVISLKQTTNVASYFLRLWCCMFS